MTREHPFAPYVRILGKGKTGTRSLEFDEARDAFGMVLRGEVEELQLGAFLMLLRVKEETPEELAGFVQACRDYIGEPPAVPVDLDWSSYAGKRNQHPWFLLSALLLAANGVRVFMHGTDGHTPGRAYAQACLAALGIDAATSFRDASEQLDQRGFAFMPLAELCPPLDRIVQLKPLLGLRSPVNTLTRMLNPLRAPCSIQSVFHPNYAPLHSGADRLLGQPASLVFKGEAGEVEIKPHARTECHLLRDGDISQFTWPRSLEGKPEPVTSPDASALRDCWRGDREDDYGTLAVQHTTAVVLTLLKPGTDPAKAQMLAAEWWQQRDRKALG